MAVLGSRYVLAAVLGGVVLTGAWSPQSAAALTRARAVAPLATPRSYLGLCEDESVEVEVEMMEVEVEEEVVAAVEQAEAAAEAALEARRLADELVARAEALADSAEAAAEAATKRLQGTTTVSASVLGDSRAAMDSSIDATAALSESFAAIERADELEAEAEAAVRASELLIDYLEAMQEGRADGSADS